MFCKLSFYVGLFITIILLVSGGVVVLLNEHWVRFEYERLEPDSFGLSSEDRVYLGVEVLNFLADDTNDSNFGNITLNGKQVFDDREELHMNDVKNLFQLVFTIFNFSLVVLLGFLVVSKMEKTKLINFVAGSRLAARVVIVLGVLVGLLALLDWEVLFARFHQTLFTQGSWQFLASDMLIRLFPEKFWIDSLAAFVGVVMLMAICVNFAASYYLKRQPKMSSS